MEEESTPDGMKTISSATIAVSIGVVVIISNLIFVPVVWNEISTTWDRLEHELEDIEVIRVAIKETMNELPVLLTRHTRDSARQDLKDEAKASPRSRRRSIVRRRRIHRRRPHRHRAAALGALTEKRSEIVEYHEQSGATKQCGCTLNNNCLAGPPGPPGSGGERGVPGKPGKPGERGIDATDSIAQHLFTGCLICPIGAEGPSGDDGQMGVSGPRGPHGTPGTPGRHGAPGPPGVVGLPGKAGKKGKRAPPGNPGMNGMNTVGRTGPKGPPGPPGPQGEQGAVGNAIEEQGDIGPRGSVGETGMRGPTGQKGKPGPAGPPGPHGDTVECTCTEMLMRKKLQHYAGIRQQLEPLNPPRSEYQGSHTKSELNNLETPSIDAESHSDGEISTEDDSRKEGSGETPSEDHSSTSTLENYIAISTSSPITSSVTAAPEVDEEEEGDNESEEGNTEDDEEEDTDREVTAEPSEDKTPATSDPERPEMEAYPTTESGYVIQKSEKILPIEEQSEEDVSEPEEEAAAVTTIAATTSATTSASTATTTATTTTAAATTSTVSVASAGRNPKLRTTAPTNSEKSSPPRGPIKSGALYENVLKVPRRKLELEIVETDPRNRILVEEQDVIWQHPPPHAPPLVRPRVGERGKAATKNREASQNRAILTQASEVDNDGIKYQELTNDFEEINQIPPPHQSTRPGHISGLRQNPSRGVLRTNTHQRSSNKPADMGLFYAARQRDRQRLLYQRRTHSNTAMLQVNKGRSRVGRPLPTHAIRRHGNLVVLNRQPYASENRILNPTPLHYYGNNPLNMQPRSTFYRPQPQSRSQKVFAASSYSRQKLNIVPLAVKGEQVSPYSRLPARAFMVEEEMKRMSKKMLNKQEMDETMKATLRKHIKSISGPKRLLVSAVKRIAPKEAVVVTANATLSLRKGEDIIVDTRAPVKGGKKRQDYRAVEKRERETSRENEEKSLRISKKTIAKGAKTQEKIGTKGQTHFLNLFLENDMKVPPILHESENENTAHRATHVQLMDRLVYSPLSQARAVFTGSQSTKGSRALRAKYKGNGKKSTRKTRVFLDRKRPDANEFL